MDVTLKFTLDLLLQLLMALTLSAATGLRAFLPLFVLSAAAHFLGLPLSDKVQFLADGRAVMVFGLATLIEILADKIPALDNLLDSINSFLKPVLGVLASYAVLSKVDPLLALVIAIALSGTLTLPTHSVKTGGRLISTATTAGIANPIISIVEDILTLLVSILAIIVPLGAGLIVLVVLVLLWRKRKVEATNLETS